MKRIITFVVLILPILLIFSCKKKDDIVASIYGLSGIERGWDVLKDHKWSGSIEESVSWAFSNIRSGERPAFGVRFDNGGKYTLTVPYHLLELQVHKWKSQPCLELIIHLEIIQASRGLNINNKLT